MSANTSRRIADSPYCIRIAYCDPPSEPHFRDYQGDNVSGKNALYTAAIAVAVVIAMKKLGTHGGIRIGS